MAEPRKETSGLMIGVILVVLITAWMMFDPSPAIPPQGGSRIGEEPITCKSDYKKCADNTELVNNYDGITAARSACKRAVNDHVQYGEPSWSWYEGFEGFFTGDDFPKTGVVRMLDEQVKIQNQYGTNVKSKVTCNYDMSTKKVLQIAINGDPTVINERNKTE